MIEGPTRWAPHAETDPETPGSDGSDHGGLLAAAVRDLRHAGVQETAGPHALFCKPGDIDSLVLCMRKAIQMEDSQYQELSRLAKVDLEQYVRPLDEYAKEYIGMIHN